MHRNVLQNSLLLFIALFTAIATAEILLRIFYDNTIKYYVWEPNLHHTFLPDSNIFYGVKGTAGFTINSDGLRGEKFSDSKNNYITLGGSTTECLYLDDTETWQYHLSKQTGFGVGNMGKSGCSLRENYIHLKYAINQFKNVKGIILMAGLNDMYKRLSHDSSYNSHFRFTSDVEDLFIRQMFLPMKRTDEKVWWRRSAIFQLARNIYHKNKQIPWTSVQDDKGENYTVWRLKRQRAKQTDTLPDLSTALKEFYTLLQAVYDQCQQQNLQLILLTQSTMYKDTMSDFEQNLLWMGGKDNFMNELVGEYYNTRALRMANDAYNNTLKDFASQHSDIMLIDIAAYLPKDTSVFYDDCHFNENGALKVAETIAEKMK